MKTRSILLAVLLAVYAISASADDCPVGASWYSGLYRYDGMGNIRAIGSDIYIYDTAGRLVSGTAEVQRGGTSRQDYGYHAYGNRISASRIAGSVECLGGCEQSPVIDGATNHITSNGAHYDAAGNPCRNYQRTARRFPGEASGAASIQHLTGDRRQPVAARSQRQINQSR